MTPPCTSLDPQLALQKPGIRQAIEEIARLAGHSSSRKTEVVYRKQLRPVLQTGATVMDGIFSPEITRRCGFWQAWPHD